MYRFSSLALPLLLLTVWSASPNRLAAQDAPAGPPAGARWAPAREPASDQPPGLTEGPPPLLERLPPTDEPLVAEPLPLDQPAPDRPPGGGLSPGGNRAPFTAQLFWIPPQNLKGQPGTLSLSGEEIKLAFPLHIAENGIWLGLADAQRLEISTSALLPDSGIPVPDELWDLEVGTLHIRDLGEGWQAGGMVRVGSPSDRPFEQLRDMTFTLLGFLTIPSGERNAWNFSLFYSPTGQIIYPLPGIAYVWRPSPQFQANVGIPFSVEYRPTDSFSVTANYRPLNHVQVQLRQTLGPLWSVYGGYQTVTETYWLADRVADEQRLYLFDQRLTLGVQRELGGRWSVDVSAAYVFDRQLFQAEKFSGSRADELGIEPGVAGTVQLIWTR